MQTVLIVDDSPLVLTVLRHALTQSHQVLNILKAHSCKEVEQILEQHQCDVAIVDVNLPDASEGEAIDVIASAGIPVIVLTGTVDERIKNIILQKKIYEFISKNGRNNINYAADLAKRVLRNYKTNILVVDDSATMRMQITGILKSMHLNVFSAEDPIKAMQIIEQEKIALVLTDYEMPNMNGMDFVLNLRQQYRKDQLMIIAISSVDKQDVVTNFLRHGANDYILKPFSEEELAVRVLEKLNILDLIAESQEKANRDFLTGAYNRRYFFETAEPVFKKSKRRKGEFAIVMFDVDHFKTINDTYGHDIGDLAIRHVSTILHDAFRTSDLVARFGGEEFCVLLEDITLKACENVLEKVRKTFESTPLQAGKISISFTTSIGVCFGLEENLDAMIKVADEGLYIAKKNGRNRVVINKSF